jgi:multiple sugar transport system substrate-binding protein
MQSGFSEDSARRYLDEITTSLTNKNVVYDITLPGAGRYYQAMDEAVYKALKGEVSPKQALDEAAKEWESITDDIGRKSQIQYYNSTLK